MIVADVRLDNREQLLSALFQSDDPHSIGDGELILRAFREWGEACPTYLLGDFAFAIFDPDNDRLFCARDHMGMRQLNYAYKSGQFFACATTADSLLSLQLTSGEINEIRIADFFQNLEGADLTSTFYRDILRLPPAHTLLISKSGVQLARYWEPTVQNC